MHRSDSDAEVVDSGSRVAVGGDRNGVIVNLLDTGDVRNAAFGHRLILSAVGGDEGASCVLNNRSADSRLTCIVVRSSVAIFSNSFLIEVLDGGIGAASDIEGFTGIVGGQSAAVIAVSEAPHIHSVSNLQIRISIQSCSVDASHVISNSCAVISVNRVNSSLQVSSPSLFDRGFIICTHIIAVFASISVSGEVVVHFVILVVNFGRSLGSVLLQTNDVFRIQSSGTVVTGVQIYIISEDNVVCGQLFAVSKLNAFTQFESIGGGFLTLVDLNIRQTGIGIIGAIVSDGFAFNTVHNNSAGTVGCEQSFASDCCNVRVIRNSREEGVELLVEGVVSDDQRNTAGFASAFSRAFGAGSAGAAALSVGVVAAGSKGSSAHSCDHCDCDKTLEIISHNRSSPCVLCPEWAKLCRLMFQSAVCTPKRGVHS